MVSSVPIIRDNVRVRYPYFRQVDFTNQVIGLYRGYKIRNVRLDSLEATLPNYLATSKVTLAN